MSLLSTSLRRSRRGYSMYQYRSRRRFTAAAADAEMRLSHPCHLPTGSSFLMVNRCRWTHLLETGASTVNLIIGSSETPFGGPRAGHEDRLRKQEPLIG